LSEREQAQTKISVVTATHNCVGQLPSLLESLRKQTDGNFEWVVADGGSSDGTLELLGSIADVDVVISSQPDFGIYDALNRALKSASGDYYIVAGADDCFYPDAIANYRRAIDKSGADIITARGMYGPHCFRIKNGPAWLFGDKAFIAQHSLGTAFRRDLHARFGFYSRKFPIAADSFFVLQACKGGATRYDAKFVAGAIGRQGVSYVDWVGSATELFRVQLLVGCALIPQVLLLLLRILKGSSTRVRSLHNAIFRRL
jgi:glycosyltransferase involved in cell wall biosynthesis